jgi:hypothetical protein
MNKKSPWYIVKDSTNDTTYYYIVPERDIPTKSRIVMKLPGGLTWLYTPCSQTIHLGHFTLKQLRDYLLRRVETYKGRLNSLEDTLKIRKL